MLLDCLKEAAASHAAAFDILTLVFLFKFSRAGARTCRTCSDFLIGMRPTLQSPQAFSTRYLGPTILQRQHKLWEYDTVSTAFMRSDRLVTESRQHLYVDMAGRLLRPALTHLFAEVPFAEARRGLAHARPLLLALTPPQQGGDGRLQGDRRCRSPSGA